MTVGEPVTAAVTAHGEGAMWDPCTQTVYWVDMLAGDVLSLSTGSDVRRRHVAAVAAALRPRRSGGMVIAIERGFLLVDESWAQVEVVAATQDRSVRMNEGGCDPQGRFYAGTVAHDVAPGAGILYRLDPDHTVLPALDGITESNGLDWSPDGTIAYFVDSPRQRIDAFDYDGATARMHGRRTLVHIDPAVGTPDGLTVDAEGCVWVALWDAAAVHCYSAGGELVSVLRLPTPRVTSCAFGGPDLADLYVTTSRLGLDDNDQVAGSLFRFQPGARGLPPPGYAGLRTVRYMTAQPQRLGVRGYALRFSSSSVTLT